MRAVVLISALILAEAIRPDVKASEFSVSFTGWLIVIAAVMDVTEFMRMFSK